MRSDYYVHLYRNKWLRVEPERLARSYYDNEIDNRGAVVSGYTSDFHPIVISPTCPGVLVGDASDVPMSVQKSIRA